jgi:hypothetical protein
MDSREGITRRGSREGGNERGLGKNVFDVDPPNPKNCPKIGNL